MTWIVGTSLAYGYSILVSDICVTFKDSTGNTCYLDCVQKIYPVGRFLLAGFAGSIEISFRMIQALEKELSRAPSDCAWDADMIATTWWPRLAKRMFNESDETQQRLGSSIIIASAHPTRNRGDAPFPCTDVHIFRWPDFAPEYASCGKVVAIGSGRGVNQYREALTQFVSDNSFTQLITFGADRLAQIFAHEISQIVNRVPTLGISRFFQVGLVTRGRIAISDFEYTIYNPDGSQTEVRFPTIARGLGQFRQFCSERQLRSETVSG